MSNWKKEAIIIFDTETTGLDEASRVIEIGIVAAEGFRAVGEWSATINPLGPVPDKITEITGITNSMVHLSPTWKAARPHIDKLLSYSPIMAAYNAPFDCKMLACQDPPINIDVSAVLDPLVWVRHVDRYVKGKGRHKLSVTAERHGVPKRQAHRALDDCMLTLGIMEKLASKLSDDTEELLAKQNERRAEQKQRYDEWKAKQPKE